MTRRLTRAAGAGALLVASALAVPAVAEVPESKDPIRLTLNDWTGQCRRSSTRSRPCPPSPI
jgi:invasion protein IalB